MFLDIYALAVVVAAVVTVTFVFWKGDEPERMGAAAYAMVSLATTMIKGGAAANVPRWGVTALEIILLIVFIVIAQHSRRAWPVWAASFQGLIVTSHILVAATLRPPLVGAATVTNMANYALLISMAVGTFWAWQERRAANMAASSGPRSL